jgi:hypothetical protein
MPKSGEHEEPSHGAFLEHVVTVLRGRPDGAVVVARGELAVEVAVSGRNLLHLDLRDLLLELRATPPELCDEVLASWLDARLAGDEGPQRWEEAAPHLRTALRTVGQAAEAEGLGVPWVLGGALPFLVETAVLALPGWSAPVSAARAAPWGRSEGEVLQRARANTGAEAEVAVHRHHEAGRTTWHVDAGDVRGAGRLVLPGFLASFAGKVDGRPIAVVPERGHLFVAGDASDAEVAGLSAKARDAWQDSAGALSPAVYTVGDDGRPVPYLRAGADRAANEVCLGHLLLASRAYSVQHPDVQRQVRSGAFVAGLDLALRQVDGRPFSWTTYAEGVPAYLPLADAVGIGPPGRPPAGWALLADLEAAAGPTFRRVVLAGLPYLDARTPLPSAALELLRARLSPEPPV